MPSNNINIVEDGKATRFKSGHKLSIGADHSLDKIMRGKILREKCFEFISNTSNGVESGTAAGAFAILRRFANAFDSPSGKPAVKGIRPGDSIKALELMLRVCGMLTDKIEIENTNPFDDLDNGMLLARLERLTLAMKSNGVVEARSDGDGGRTETSSGRG